MRSGFQQTCSSLTISQPLILCPDNFYQFTVNAVSFIVDTNFNTKYPDDQDPPCSVTMCADQECSDTIPFYSSSYETFEVIVNARSDGQPTVLSATMSCPDDNDVDDDGTYWQNYFDTFVLTDIEPGNSCGKN